MKVTTARIPTPEMDWGTIDKRWISLRDVRLNGGFVFHVPMIPIEPLFEETWTEPDVPWLVDLGDGRIGVFSGEITVIRALLAGKSGIEARLYRGW